MNFILISLLFVSYFFLCKNDKLKHFWAVLFIGFSVVLRMVISLEDNYDYNQYLVLYDYDYSFNLKSILNEPIIKIVYQINYWFLNDKKSSINILYWQHFIICTLIYFKIAKINLVFFKKIVIFSFFYFLFTYTLLRNGICYLLVFLFFYEYNNEGESKLKKLIIPVLLHVSALLVLGSYVLSQLKLKHIVYLASAFVAISFLLVFGEIINLEHLLLKYHAYADSSNDGNIFHTIWMIFISCVFVISFFENKKRASNKLHIILFIVYFVLNIISPVMGYRVSLYYMMFYLSLTITNVQYNNITSFLNIGSLVLFIMFFLGFITTHYNI